MKKSNETLGQHPTFAGLPHLEALERLLLQMRRLRGQAEKADFAPWLAERRYAEDDDDEVTS